MTNTEFSNEFEILYNSITSNQAPGLDEYEKSVFLTKAQDEIVKAYFNPRSNKTQEGFDGNERRQIDFSMITRIREYPIVIELQISKQEGLNTKASNVESILNRYNIYLDKDKYASVNGINIIDSNSVLTINTDNPQNFYASISNKSDFIITDVLNPDLAEQSIYFRPFFPSFFDLRDNTKAVVLPKDSLMIINEYTEVKRFKESVRLATTPITYTEYFRLTSKPFKRPLKNQAWRILDNSNDNKMSEIIVGPGDIINKYVLRYIKKPRAIRLITFEDITLDGDSIEQTCELDPILHPEILQRAVELAKAAYQTDIQAQILRESTSETNIGVIPSSN